MDQILLRYAKLNPAAAASPVAVLKLRGIVYINNLLRTQGSSNDYRTRRKSGCFIFFHSLFENGVIKHRVFSSFASKTGVFI